MKLRLVRIFNCKDYCIGKLYVNGKYFCDVIEDCDRGLDQKMSVKDIVKKKIKGLTAIPVGLYHIAMNIVSQKYSKKKFFNDLCKGRMPRLLSVSGYEGILIHPGNTAKDSEGCLIVGFNKIKGQVVNSTDTFVKLYALLSDAYNKKEDITIEITRNFKV